MGVDPVTLGVITTALTAAGTAYTVLNKPKKPSAPKLKQTTPEDAAKQAALAAERKRKQAQSAFGLGDTVLTGPSGLGSSGGTGKGTTTSLGY